MLYIILCNPGKQSLPAQNLNACLGVTVFSSGKVRLLPEASSWVRGYEALNYSY